MLNKWIGTTALSGAMLYGCFAQHALGQAAQAQAGAPAAKSELEEVVVTATRRATNLQSTPVAVSALGSYAIEQASPHDLSDLAKFVPGLNIAKIPANNAAAFAIRGSGSVNVIVYFETPVAVLVDDFVVPSIQSQLLDTFDVDQVEVLRGPQGTLFGKNTTAGVVAVTTKKPVMDEYQAQLQAGGGDFGSWYTKAAVNIPLVNDKLALRAVFAHDNSDGYYKNGASYGPINLPGTPNMPITQWNGLSGSGTGETIGGNSTSNARIKLLYQPTDDIDALLQYQFLRDQTESPSVNTTPAGAFVWNGLGFPGQNTGDPLDHAGETERQGDPSVVVHGAFLSVNDRQDFGTFTSVTGYWSQVTHLKYTTTGQPPVIGTEGDPLSLFDLDRADAHGTFQQELRFASNFDGPLNFVAGAFYQDDQINFCVSQFLGFTGPFLNDNPYILCNAQWADSYAGYTEATYKAFDNKLSISGGLRYSTDDKKWKGRQQALASGITGNPATPANYFTDIIDASDFGKYPAGVVTDKRSWTEPTYRVSISYQATDELFTYFTYSHGYKAGGFNDQTGGFAAFGTDLNAFREAGQPTDPEFADSFEVGFKLQAFQNRLRANVTGFIVDYSDLQENINVPIVVNGVSNQITKFVNAASANVKGIEAEVTVLPTAGLSLQLIADYQSGGYGNFTSPGAGYDLASAPLGRLPEWQITFNATYSMPLANWGLLTLNSDVSYIDKNLFIQSIASPAGNSYLDARTLLGFQATLSDPDETKYIKLIGRNLTDERYKTGDYIVANLWEFTSYGPPRYFGVEVGAKF